MRLAGTQVFSADGARLGVVVDTAFGVHGWSLLVADDSGALQAIGIVGVTLQQPDLLLGAPAPAPTGKGK